ncbi:hypothetical protein U9M48_021625 [Paspalum notatum var. saurae]|uniref:RNA polymerase II C-terminal domain phosphatase-like n=1 Tax=Paspalum notatum var. saurae TaxID=547442 RepID=A0AAQ3WTY7_PASNO
MSEVKQGGNDDDAPHCPPHPGFVRGFCSLCGAKAEDTEGGALGVVAGTGSEMKKQGGDDNAASCPPHPGFVDGLCSKCEAKEDAGASTSTLAAAGNIHGGAVASAPTTNIPRASDRATLLRTKKLILILDLDHTLLNSTSLNDFSAIERRQGFTRNTKDDPGLELFRVEPYGIPMLTKLRPFARSFLAQASTMFEMYVYTLAGSVYAKDNVKLLDPDGVYFGERIVSSLESKRPDMKNLDVIPGAEDATVVIVDDTDAAWPSHQDNLILIGRYLYFASECRKFDYQIESLAERGLDEREHDGALAVVLDVLNRVHKGFFDSVHDHDGHCADVRAVIKEVRSQVLRGCTVVFSLSESLDEDELAYEEDSPIWDLADELGAVCELDVDDTITHVIAEDPDTEKAQWARDNAKFLVNPDWIKAAGFSWRRQDELDFPAKKEEDRAGGAPGSSSSWNVPRAPDRATLLRTMKLVLILDLDHTLLNSTRLDDLSAIEQEKGFATSTITKDDPSLELFRVEPNGVPVLTKLRPFARGLLEEASAMFEMYVYTLAGRDYARKNAKLLDPDGVYFVERIVSSQESSRPHMKNLDVIPGAEEATVVIVDDMSIHQDNLILIDRCLYFASARRNFEYQNDDSLALAERGLDESEHDGPLAVVLSDLKRIHKGFFDSVRDDEDDDHRADVQEVITEVRSQVLRGCTVVFSLSETLRGRDESEENFPIWDLAEQLGAVCLLDVGETVTHVVAEDPGTEKAQWARDNNKFLVDPAWINAASFRWCRQDERGFPRNLRPTISESIRFSNFQTMNK